MPQRTNSLLLIVDAPAFALASFEPNLLSLIKECLKQTCKMPDRTSLLLLIVDLPAFEPASFEPVLLYVTRAHKKEDLQSKRSSFDLLFTMTDPLMR